MRLCVARMRLPAAVLQRGCCIWTPCCRSPSWDNDGTSIHPPAAMTFAFFMHTDDLLTRVAHFRTPDCTVADHSMARAWPQLTLWGKSGANFCALSTDVVTTVKTSFGSCSSFSRINYSAQRRPKCPSARVAFLLLTKAFVVRLAPVVVLVLVLRVQVCKGGIAKHSSSREHPCYAAHNSTPLREKPHKKGRILHVHCT